MKIIRFIGWGFASFTILIVLLGATGCARYRIKTLKHLTPRISSRSNESVIAFAYDVFDRRDCKRYLNRDVISKGYQPIHIALTNNTSHYVKFSPDTFSFTCVSVEEVAESVHTNTAGRAVGYGVVGLFIWPFLIPAIVDGVGSSHANERLDEDFARKGLDIQIIAPMTSVDGIIFASLESFDPDFSFVVTDMTTKQHYTLSPNNSKRVVSS